MRFIKTLCFLWANYVWYKYMFGHSCHKICMIHYVRSRHDVIYLELLYVWYGICVVITLYGVISLKVYMWYSSYVVLSPPYIWIPHLGGLPLHQHQHKVNTLECPNNRWGEKKGVLLTGMLITTRVQGSCGLQTWVNGLQCFKAPLKRLA